jgi:hypothetical protein
LPATGNLLKVDEDNDHEVALSHTHTQHRAQNVKLRWGVDDLGSDVPGATVGWKTTCVAVSRAA